MRELIKNHEVWNTESDKFDHTVTVWKEEENYYQLRHSARGSFDLDSLPTPSPIPMHLFLGRWDTSLTEAPQPPPTNSYLKSPPVCLYDDYTSDQTVDVVTQENRHVRAPGDDMVEEAKIYEILRRHPHPNICVYYGCVRNGDSFTALCLKKYGRCLHNAVCDGDSTLDPRAIHDGISKGLQFLHETLGLVHNDINPCNIMLDDDGNAIIIDFDSCMPIGQNIEGRKAGTFGWEMDPAPSTSDPDNDMYGLKLIAKFMEEKRAWRNVSVCVAPCYILLTGLFSCLLGW